MSIVSDTIENRIYHWVNLTLSKLLGWQNETLPRGRWVNPTIELSADLMADDTIHISINGNKFSQIFTISHETTLTTLLATINANAAILALGISLELNVDDVNMYTIDITLTDNSISTKIQTWVVNAGEGTCWSSIVPIVWANQNGLIPDQSYVSLNTLNNPVMNMNWKSEVEIPMIDDGAGGEIPDPDWPDGKQYVQWTEEWAVSVQTYGVLNGIYMGALQYFLGLQEVENFFDQNALSASIISAAKDISTPIDNQNEQRMNMDMNFRSSLRMIDEPGFIEQIEYSGTIDTHDFEN